jgi:L-rhamnose mutarotase
MCFTFELYEGAEAEYKRRHDAIWPELVAAIQEGGLKNYSLFRRGTQIVAYVECHPDAATAFGRVGAHEANSRWSAWFEDLIVNLTDSEGKLMELKEVWHLD